MNKVLFKKKKIVNKVDQSLLQISLIMQADKPCMILLSEYLNMKAFIVSIIKTYT